MRFLFLLLVAIPVIASAQPEKVRAGMTHQEFLETWPDAQRDWEMEALVLEMDTVYGTVSPIAGKMFWKYYNDTIQGYRFRSVFAFGPCARYPLLDSQAVTGWKKQLESTRLTFESELGKPAVYENVPIIGVSEKTDHHCYLAVWVLADGKSVTLSIRNDDAVPNRRDKLAVSANQKTSVYVAEIKIDSRVNYCSSMYGVGLSVKRFGEQFPRYASKLEYDENMPSYLFVDSAVCENACWSFDFDGDEMYGYTYDAEYGVYYGAVSDAAAYEVLNRKAEQLLASLTALYGAPDSLRNGLPMKYSQPTRGVEYERYWLYAKWERDDGPIVLVFKDTGDGIDPYADFTLYVDWYTD